MILHRDMYDTIKIGKYGVFALFDYVNIHI